MAVCAGCLFLWSALPWSLRAQQALCGSTALTAHWALTQPALVRCQQKGRQQELLTYDRGWKSSVNSIGDGLSGKKLPEGSCVGVSALLSLLLCLLSSFCPSPPGSSWCLFYELERNGCFCLNGRGNTGHPRFSGDPALLLIAMMLVLVVTFGVRAALFGCCLWALEQSCFCVHYWSVRESSSECTGLQSVIYMPGVFLHSCVSLMYSCWDYLLGCWWQMGLGVCGPGPALGHCTLSTSLSLKHF